MPHPSVRVCHRNRLLSECLAAALNESGIVDCAILVSDTLENSSPNSIPRDTVDVLLLDPTLDDGLSHRLADQVRDRHPACKIILIVAENAVSRMHELARIANHGCLFEGVGLGDVRTAIAAILAGQFYCSPQLANALMTQAGQVDVAPASRQAGHDAVLTSREREILELIDVERLGNKQIARRLGVSLYTIKNHVHNIIEKLGVQDRHDAAQLARRRHLLDGNHTSHPERSTIRLPR